MITKDSINKIILESINAPSGSNSQPWEFIVKEKENKIKIKYLPQKDHPILNYKNRGTLIACGAVIENILITANHYGYNTGLIIKDNFDDNIVAEIVLNQGENNYFAKDLFEYIKNRTTNRKKFLREKISEEDKKYLFSDLKKYGDFNFYIKEDGVQINELAKNLAYDTYLNFKNPELHKILFKEILFDDKKAQEGEQGLYIKTMEFPRAQIPIIKLFKNRKFFEFLDKAVGISNNIYKDSQKMYLSCGALIAITTPNTQKDFINLGRVLENVWLKATKLGLALHLITGILFFWQEVNWGDKNIFNNEEKDIINKSYNEIKKIFGVKEELIGLIFRLGKSDPPSAKSIKKEPIIIFE